MPIPSNYAPAPFSLDVNEDYCGAKSLWARPGANPVACYLEDVTPEMIAQHRALEESSSN